MSEGEGGRRGGEGRGASERTTLGTTDPWDDCMQIRIHRTTVHSGSMGDDTFKARARHSKSRKIRKPAVPAFALIGHLGLRI